MRRRSILFLTLCLIPWPTVAATDGWELLQHTAVPLADGGFATARVDRDRGESWGVFVRSYVTALQPRTPEIRANNRLAGDQWQPSLAPLAGGGFAVAWNSQGQDGSGWGLYLRRFGVDGRPLGAEQLASAPRAGDQTGSIHPLPNGGFVAVWTSPAPEGSGRRILARRFSANGASHGPAVPLRTFATGEAFHLAVAGPADNLLVVWSVQPRKLCGWRAQRFGLDGRPRGAAFGICTLTLGDSGAPPQVSAGPSGYVAVWDGGGIWARRYSLAGKPLGPTFTVDQYYWYVGSVPTGAPRVAHTPAGAFVVVWETFPCVFDCEIDSDEIAWRAYGPDGKPWTDEAFLLFSYFCRPGSWAPRIAAGPRGRLAVSRLTFCATDGDEAPRLTTALLTPAPPTPPSLPPWVSFSDLRTGVNEEDGEAVVRVQRMGAVPGPVSVDYATAEGGTATPEADYLPISGTLRWEAGDLSDRTLRIPIVADGLPEEAESFALLLRNPTGGLQASPSPIVIHIDHPGFLGFRAEELPVEEGVGGLRVWVDRRDGRRGEVSARFGDGPYGSAPEGLAELGVDYLPVSGTLHWTDGDAAPRSFVVPILDDAEIEDMEGFSVWLTDLTGAMPDLYPASTSAWVTIQDDELSLGPGRLELAVETMEARESDGIVRIPVRRHGGMGGTVSVHQSTVAGSAQPGLDFGASSGLLTWGDSDLSVHGIPLRLIDDSQVEGDETLEIVLSDPQGGAGLGEITRLRLTIHDDDAP